MRGKGTSQPRTCSGRKALKRCKNTGEADNVVLIDVDSDNIIIIDIPDSLPQKQRGSSIPRENKKCPLRTIICIDDDESADSNHLGIGVEGADNFHSDGSSSMRSRPTSNHSRNSLDADGDECQFVEENISPIKISKCKRTYSGKASTRSRYGLSSEPESSSSGNDCPDSEFMEGSSGKLQEQWEKAFFKRKNGVCSGHQASASRSHSDTRQNVEVENMTEQRPKPPVCSSSSNASHEKAAHNFTNQGSFVHLPEHWKKTFCNGRSGTGNHASTLRFNSDVQQNVEVEKTDSQTKAPGCSSSSSPFTTAGDFNLGNTSPNPTRNSNADFDLKSTEETRFSWSKADVQDRGESFTADPAPNYAEWQPCRHFKHDVSCFCDQEKQSSRGPFCSTPEQDNEHVNFGKEFSHIKEKNPWAETCLSNSEPRVDINFGHSKASLMVDEVFTCNSQCLPESVLDHGRFVNRNKSEKFHQTASSSNELKQKRTSFADKEKSVSGEPSFRNTQSSDGTLVNHGVVSDDEVAAVSGGTFCKGPSLVKSGISNEKGCSQERKSLPDEPSFCNFHYNETQIGQGKSCLVEEKEISAVPMSDSQQLDEMDNSMDTQNGDVTSTIHSCLISKREKLKETDEYKRAIEEEWASRQRELQIQAEEAQQLRRLRKREKAESMRLLDMERRQKQRVEEIRETQKKDEENMNVKEQLRAEVRKELNKLEMMCSDMASLLRGLGIDVSGGLHPSPTEVRVAYKRALLSFHPDRALGSDVRQLVEAEEKFKLISRMKEKFLSS